VRRIVAECPELPAKVKRVVLELLAGEKAKGPGGAADA
jgi:hypothetical protein